MKIDEPHAVDVHVGQRLRAMRKEVGLSQEALAQAVGLTFQQIQKYERGANRVSASKLWQFAGVLHTTVGNFYDGLGDASEGVAPSKSMAQAIGIMATAGGPELVDSYLHMQPRLRRAFIDLAKAGCCVEA